LAGAASFGSAGHPNDCSTFFYPLVFYQHNFRAIVFSWLFMQLDLLLMKHVVGLKNILKVTSLRQDHCKTMEFEMNSITNSVAAKQVIDRIINEFFDSNPK
jgi:hypothetical protein